MSGVQYASGDSAGGDLTEIGELHRRWKAAMAEGRAADVEAARQAIREYHNRNGTWGRVVQMYATPGQARTVRPSTPAHSGGSSLLGDILRLRLEIASVRRDASLARLAARRQRAAVNAPRVVRNLAGVVGRIEYDDDAFDDLDFEFVVSDAEAERQARSLIG